MNRGIAAALALLSTTGPLCAAEPAQPVIFFALDTDSNPQQGWKALPKTQAAFASNIVAITIR